MLSPAAPVAAAPLDPTMLEQMVPAIVQVAVLLEDSDGIRYPLGIGSGSIVSAEGLILTNAHVVDPTEIRSQLATQQGRSEERGEPFPYQLIDNRFVISISDGRHPPEPRFVAGVSVADEDLDLALLRIDTDIRDQPVDPASLNLPTLKIGSSGALNIGDPLHVFGFPAIGEGSLVYTSGIVSGFLYSEGIDGPAWINTDAVMSGGNSGGAAVDDRGLLVGVPTGGTPLDCRPGDTDGDGRETAADTGCVPTGGSLGQVRPIDLALPLLRSVGAAPDVLEDQSVTAVAATVGTTAEQSGENAPTSVEGATAADTARSCAGRGDFRCANRFFAAALQATPDDPALRTEAYNALLGLGALEEDAGQLGEARAAYEAAQALTGDRTEAGAALATLAPYSRIRYADGFAGERRFAVTDGAESRAAYGDGTFGIEVRQPGLVSGYPLGDTTVSGENYAVALDVVSTSGSGAVALEFRTDPDGGDWMVTVDPVSATWAVYLKSDGGPFSPWVEPTDYSVWTGAPVNRVEVQVKGDLPTLLINGVDVAGEAQISLPAFGSEGAISFGATMDLDSGEPFTAMYDRVSIYLLA